MIRINNIRRVSSRFSICYVSKYQVSVWYHCVLVICSGFINYQLIIPNKKIQSSNLIIILANLIINFKLAITFCFVIYMIFR